MQDKVIIKVCRVHGELTADQCFHGTRLRCKICERTWDAARRIRDRDKRNARKRESYKKDDAKRLARNESARLRRIKQKLEGTLKPRKPRIKEILAKAENAKKRLVTDQINNVLKITGVIKRAAKAKQIHKNMLQQTSNKHENNSGN